MVPLLPDLLAEHGLTQADEQPLEHAGFSGATITRLVRDGGASFVLKRMSIERDWIMRATEDVACREAAFASARLNLGKRITTPAIGVAQDGAEFALLMHDITSHLLPQGLVTADQLDAIIAGMAELHRVPAALGGMPWCGLRERLMLLTPKTARIAEAYGAPVAGDIAEGWRLFERHASARARAIISSLMDDPRPLIAALVGLPSRFLHGDLKFDNIGLDGEGRMWLIDWAMTLVAPAAVELGWFLAINSRRLPDGVSLDDVMAAYVDASGISGEERARHDALTAVCGLLLRGWRKALDAEAGEPEELRWWCERVEAAEGYLATG
jgi:aminoglycoside phosphotransferase (APT) family kinase protein